MKGALTVFLTFILYGCSSLMKERPVKLHKETSADGFSEIGDQARINRDYRSALENYNKASDIYIFKLNKKKWALNELKKVLVFSWQGKKKSASRVLERVRMIEKSENLGLRVELMAVELQISLQQKRDGEEFLKLGIIKKAIKDDFPRWSYYHFIGLEYWPEKFSDQQLTECQVILEKLIDLYDGGELSNLEPLIYGSMVYAKALLKKDHPSTFQAIKQAEMVYREQELTGRIDDIFRLYITYYKKHEKKNMVGLYQNFLKRFRAAH